MKVRFFVFIVCILLCSCSLKEEQDKGPITTVEQKDIYDEEFILSFYNQVLDTLVSEDFVLSNVPHHRGVFGVFQHEALFIPDSTHFDWHLERFHHFTWPVKKAVSHKTIRQIFSQDITSEVAWNNFRQQYGNKVIMEISTPFFSPDFQMAYVSVVISSNMCGWENDYIYKRENGRWVLKYKDGDWID